jgi:BNR repeat-like domain
MYARWMLVRMRPSFRTWAAPAILLIALLLAGCGGGGGGSGGGGPPPPPPPPPQEPPVFTTATAVRVTGPTPFSANCLAVPAGATAYANAEVEPHLAINPSNPNHLVAAWQQDRLSDGGARGLATAVSVDGGTTWSRPQASPFSQCAGGVFARVSDPWVAVSGSTVLQIGIAFTGAAGAVGARSAVLVSRSTDGGATWGPAVALVDDDGNRFFNDKESLTIDATDSRYVYAVWDRLDPSEHGVTLLARSTDGGVSWSSAVTVYDPGAGRQTIGNVAVTTPDGVVHVFFTELGPVAGNPAAIEGSLAVIRSTDKGVTWSAPTRIAPLLAVGTRVPSQTSITVRAGEVLGAFAANPVDGTLYAAWQDARFTGGTHDAIVLARSADGGGTWSAPLRVSADATVPAFTPTLAVLPARRKP